MARRLRRLREKAGLTQEALAKKSGVGRVTIARLETNKADVRVSALLKLARALGCKLDDLVDR